MSIYENGPKPKKVGAKRTNIPPQKVDPKEILNDSKLTDLVRRIPGGPDTAKEILYDVDKNIVGVLQRNNEPFILTKEQSKELEKLLGE